jgi:hypothetical protein
VPKNVQSVVFKKGCRLQRHGNIMGPRLSILAPALRSGCGRACHCWHARRSQAPGGRRDAVSARARMTSPLACPPGFPERTSRFCDRLPSSSFRLAVGCEAGVEPATARVTISCSTTELVAMVEYAGLEPTTSRQGGRSTAELISGSFEYGTRHRKAARASQAFKTRTKVPGEECALAA